MRISTAFALLAAAAAIACGGDATSLTGNDGGNGGNNGGNNGGTGGNTDVTTKVNELLGEINSSQNAISKGAAGGGAADRMLATGANLSARPIGAALAAAGALFDTQPDNAALCVLDSASSMWKCPMTVSPAGDTVTVSFQFLDTANAVQLHFDTASTASIRRVSDSHNASTKPVQTSTGPVDAFQVDTQHQDIVLSGIRSGDHQQNGTGTIHHMIAMPGRDTAFITAPTTTTAIVTGPNVPYPIGGSYTAVVHTVQGKSNSTTTQTTSFDGTKIAKLVISFASSPNTPRTCTYDMTATTPPTCSGGPSGPPGGAP